MVGWRNPARYLVPLAIAAVAAAAYLIVHHALMHKTTSTPIPIVQSSSTTSTVAGHKVSNRATFYIVHPNDTLSKIAARTGVPVATLERLNPGVNPSALHVSQRLRLRQ